MDRCKFQFLRILMQEKPLSFVQFSGSVQKWLTDITEFQIPAGKVYLSPVIDCFDGMVISWSIGTQPDAGLVNTMLDEIRHVDLPLQVLPRRTGPTRTT